MARKTRKNELEVLKKKTELKQKYALQFTKHLKILVNNLKKKDSKKLNQIYEDLDISRTAFNEYLNNKLPKQIETIFLIKDYFDVPFSYLFGEMKSLERTELSATVNYGISAKSLNVLKDFTQTLQKEDMNGETKESIEARQKLIFTEDLLENGELLDLIVKYFNSCLENKNKENLDFLKAEIYRVLIYRLDRLILEILGEK